MRGNHGSKYNSKPANEFSMVKLFIPPRQLRKYLLIQIILAALVLYFWVWYNGGFLPKFLQHRLPLLRVGPDINALAFFGTDDGSQLKWSHGVNSREAVQKCLDDKDISMVEGDVILRGQGTGSQSLIPVMASPPDTDSSLKLVDWLQLFKSSSKGIKLDFKTIDAVEISLQKVKDIKNELKLPVWIHADVLAGPFGVRPPVDPARFLRTLNRLFPECTLSLGWTTERHTDLRLAGYTWEMVLNMYELKRKYDLKMSLIFVVRLSMVRNSVLQLKWLCDVTQGSLLVWNEPGDKSNLQDLSYVSYRFPPDRTYFDLNDAELDAGLKKYRHFSSDKIENLVTMRDTVAFQPNAWVKMGLHIEHESLLPSTEGIVLRSHNVYIVTKTHYKGNEHIKLIGRVMFINTKKVDAVARETGLNIYLRPLAYSNYERISGIRCFIGVTGDIIVEGSNLNGVPKFSKSQKMVPSSTDCYRFTVMDDGKNVRLQITILHDCDTLESIRKEDEELHIDMTVEIPEEMPAGKHPFIVKLEDSKRTAVLDELTVRYKPDE